MKRVKKTLGVGDSFMGIVGWSLPLTSPVCAQRLPSTSRRVSFTSFSLRNGQNSVSVSRHQSLLLLLILPKKKGRRKNKGKTTTFICFLFNAKSPTTQKTTAADVKINKKRKCTNQDQLNSREKTRKKKVLKRFVLGVGGTSDDVNSTTKK